MNIKIPLISRTIHKHEQTYVHISESLALLEVFIPEHRFSYNVIPNIMICCFDFNILATYNLKMNTYIIFFKMCFSMINIIVILKDTKF